MKAFPSRRLVPEQRTFSSESVEALTGRVAAAIADPELAWLFQNCLPNTLDTTIDFRDEDGPDTFVITGDIPAMWLRDSAAQVWPFLPLARGEEKLRAMLAGVCGGRPAASCWTLTPTPFIAIRCLGTGRTT
jgi:meiotically up-regulated gene 157 (Mug157) protein